MGNFYSKIFIILNVPCSSRDPNSTTAARTEKQAEVGCVEAALGAAKLPGRQC